MYNISLIIALLLPAC
jgi:integrase